MVPAFEEAIRATTQPCTLLLLLPALAMAVVTSGRWSALAAVCVGAVGGGWLFATNTVVLSGTALRFSGVVVVLAVCVALVLPYVTQLRPRITAGAQTAIAGGVSFAATLWWRPCVGRELGAILTASRHGVAAQLPGMTAYMLGAMVPVLAVVLAIRACDPSPTASRWAGRIAGGAGIVVAGALALGRHDELVTTLTRWTTA